jgi:hypothetical protein
MAFVQNEDPVEALISDGPDEPLGVRIGSRCSPRGAQDPDPLRLEHLVKGGAEPIITVVYQELDRNIAGFPYLGQIAGDLGALGQIGGSVGHSTDQDLPGVEIDEEEHMERLQPDRLDREEVAGDDRSGLVPHELTPGVSLGPWPSLRGGDPSDTRRRDLYAQLLELSLDAPVAPEWVLFRQSPDEELGLERDPPSRIDSMRSSPFSTDDRDATAGGCPA